MNDILKPDPLEPLAERPRNADEECAYADWKTAVVEMQLADVAMKQAAQRHQAALVRLMDVVAPRK